jgi:hypothetical protein
MARYATPEWITAFDHALAAIDLSPADRAPLVVQYALDHAPADCMPYALRVDAAGARVIPGSADDADVTFRQDYDTAVAIARGERSAQRAVLDGSIVISGDATRLIGRTSLLAAVDRAAESLG